MELVPAEDGAARPPTAASQDSLTSQDGRRSSQAHDGGGGLQPFRPAAKERRHQIPGLRKTPYLKVFLLRCDDSEIYKSTARKQVREWVRTHTPASHGSGNSSAQEKHDACEWLIVHVVMPNTSASAQPRFSGSTSSSTGTAKDRSNSTRWPGGKSTTIFEKIRSDFNSSSSSAPDRVAQVRIQNDELPPERQFPGSVVSITAFEETPQERSNAWADVVAKFKTLILLSFDSRVSQYEDDIREKEVQRALPGWNFCTFFVLKEGLAKSFEGVGLVEDSLVIYDELDIGLDSVIKEKSAGLAQTNATTFLDSTPELKGLVQSLLDTDGISDGVQELMRKPISERSKNYREMILSSNISIFDFKCYLFARQIALLIRLGKHSIESLSTPRTPRKSSDGRRNSFDDVARKRSFEPSNEEDFGALAEVSRRTLSFVTNVARILRNDIRHSVSEDESHISSDTINNFVWSWTMAVVEQLLSEASSSVLNPTTGASGGSQGSLTPLKIPRTRTPSGSNEPLSAGAEKSMHPARSTSLSYRPSSVVEPAYAQSARRTSGETGRSGDVAARFGFVELNTSRAELYLLERRVLEQLGSLQHWEVGWAALERGHTSQTNGFSEISLSTGSSPSQNGTSDESDESDKPKHLTGLCHSILIQATTSVEEFRKTYEALSDNVIRLHQAAGQTRSVENMLTDLAILKYDAGDFAGAASLFGRVTPLFADSKWNSVEVAILRIYGRCLKRLNRKDDYVRVLLLILSKAAARWKATKAFKSRPVTSPGMRRAMDSSLSWLDDDDIHASGILKELVEYSDELPYDVTVPMGTYFSDIAVEPHAIHYEDRDGFQLNLKFRHLLEDDFTAESMQVRLVGTSTEQKRDIVLDSDGALDIERGLVRCSLHTNVSTRQPLRFWKLTRTFR